MNLTNLSYIYPQINTYEFFLMVSLTILSFTYFTSAGQSLTAAIQTAKKENKIILVVVESEKCAQCNEVANRVLTSDIAKRSINTNCVMVRENKIPEELNGPYCLYSFPENFYGAIYLDAEGNILQVYSGSSSSYRNYIENLEKALKEKESSSIKLKSQAA